MPRRYGRGTSPRRRFQKIRHNIQAYSVPRQGIRVRRTPAQAQAEYSEAAARLRYRNAQREARRRSPVHARPLKKKRSLWSWLWR